jgi:hypothetical protein
MPVWQNQAAEGSEGISAISLSQRDRHSLCGGAGAEFGDRLIQSGLPMLEALNAGSIDISQTGDALPIIVQTADAPLVYIGGGDMEFCH